MKKFLIGGSPCTHWSIAQSKNRETSAEGIGWELFRNYLIAKEKFKPSFFLYENNKSAAQAIKDQIAAELEAPLQYINSALVSAQNRQRFYAHNFGEVPLPEDRGIRLQDILESGTSWLEKAYAYTTRCTGAIPSDTLKRKRHTMVAERVIFEEANYPVINGAKVIVTERAIRQGDRKGTKQGKYVYLPTAEKTNTISAGQAHNEKVIVSKPKGTWKTVYDVVNGEIKIDGEKYAINLPDGQYIIRKLTVTEAERLQTLPDGYTRAVSSAQAYKGIGNGWTAEVIIHLLSYALKDIPKDEEIIVLSMYDGIGTGRYCFDKLGYHNIKYYAYEIDKYAMQIANSNYADIIQCGDAFQVREEGWEVEQ